MSQGCLAFSMKTVRRIFQRRTKPTLRARLSRCTSPFQSNMVESRAWRLGDERPTSLPRLPRAYQVGSPTLEKGRGHALGHRARDTDGGQPPLVRGCWGYPQAGQGGRTLDGAALPLRYVRCESGGEGGEMKCERHQMDEREIFLPAIKWPIHEPLIECPSIKASIVMCPKCFVEMWDAGQGCGASLR